MTDITQPLSELEKAELTKACQDCLTQAGVLLLRRLMFQTESLSASPPIAPVKEVQEFIAAAVAVHNRSPIKCARFADALAALPAARPDGREREAKVIALAQQAMLELPATTTRRDLGAALAALAQRPAKDKT